MNSVVTSKNDSWPRLIWPTLYDHSMNLYLVLNPAPNSKLLYIYPKSYLTPKTDPNSRFWNVHRIEVSMTEVYHHRPCCRLLVKLSDTFISEEPEFDAKQL